MLNYIMVYYCCFFSIIPTATHPKNPKKKLSQNPDVPRPFVRPMSQPTRPLTSAETTRKTRMPPPIAVASATVCGSSCSATCLSCNSFIYSILVSPLLNFHQTNA